MLQALSTTDHDPLINEAFLELDESIFNSSCLDQPWMSEVFDVLPDGNLLQDDLLTDAVSEILKNRVDLPCTEFTNAHDFDDVVIGDEVEINTISTNPCRPIIKDALGDSSGYTSGTLSSTCLSPSNSSQITSPGTNDSIPSTNTSDDNVRIKSEDTQQGNKITHSSIIKRFTETSEPPILTSKRTFIKREMPNAANRVHLILRHNPSNIQIGNRIIHYNRAAIGQDNTVPTYLDKTVTHPSDLMHPCSDHSIFNESPIFAGSHSSSDSDIRDNSEDEHMTDISYSAILDVYGNEQSSRSQCSSGFTKSATSYRHAVSPLSRLPGLKYSYDEDVGYNYPHSARIVSQNLFRTQLSSSRMRSPVRMDRSDSGIVVLSSEEKRTLIAEGYTIPSRLPLTKQEERNLKKVRRKIKNKISAQESRRKKKEYLEALERKVNLYSQDNVDLRRRVDGLESTNRSLLGQLRLLQQLVNKSKGYHNSAVGSVTAAAPVSSVKSTNLLNPPPNNKSSTGQQHVSNNNPGNGSTPDGESGSASTCLMVFALCFVALLVGQPLQPVSHSNTGAALSSATAHLFSSRFLGSGSQIDRVWPTTNQKTAPPGRQRHHMPQNGIFHSSWLSGDYFQWSYSNRPSVPESPKCVAEPTAVQSGGGEGASAKHSVPTASASNRGLPTGTISEHKPEPRSRLLGSPSELAECSAPPKRTLWSYLFGESSSTKSGSALGGICTQLEYTVASLDAIEKHWPPELVAATAELRMHNHHHQLGSNRSDVPQFRPDIQLPSPDQLTSNSSTTIAGTSWMAISA